MKNKSLISITDFNTEEILRTLEIAAEFEAHPQPHLLDGKVVATLFFEPSTRTRLSFESAVNRMGGRVIGFSDPDATSVSKGETLKDTVKIVSNYCDLIVMRHPLEGSSRYAAEVANIPVINAGDGANQHPTQTLLDLYSIKKTQGRLDNITILMVGDLKYGRTVHSLLQAMGPFSPVFHFISHKDLRMPDEYKHYLDSLHVKYEEHENLAEILPYADIVYMTRVQRERFLDPMEYERTKDMYVLNNAMLADTKPNMKILHPLPRVNEINQDVDDNSKAYYFEQARNGVFARQAVISAVLGLKK